MKKVSESHHVLMVVDKNYSERVDAMPHSGVSIESKWIRDVIDEKPADWLCVLYSRNPEKKLPAWMACRNPKSFDYNYDFEKGRFPGSEQIEDLWRWIEGLPPDKSNAISPALIRKRMCRVEKVDTLRDPANWSLPDLEGFGIEFRYNDAPRKSYSLGYGSYKFLLSVSSRGPDDVYVYDDHIKAVGLISDSAPDKLDANGAYSYITSGRDVRPCVGQRVVLLNQDGCVCVVRIAKIEQEVNGDTFVPARIFFDYEIFTEEAKE
jgi:hypothetical protein